MAKLRQIAQLGSAVLRKKAQAVTRCSDETVQSVISDMQITLSDSNGVGMAAPQIYESWRIVIIASRPTPRYPTAPNMEPIVMINPKFKPLSPEVEKDWEGCLSIPGIRALVPRYREILVNFTDQSENRINLNLEGFVARIFQHEYDHLDGLVYLDRVENNQEIISEKEFLKLINSG